MSSNNLIKQPFGLNIALPFKQAKEIQQAAANEIADITVKPVTDFLNSNYNLSLEEIADEKQNIFRQIYILGQQMNSNQPGVKVNFSA